MRHVGDQLFVHEDKTPTAHLNHRELAQIGVEHPLHPATAALRLFGGFLLAPMVPQPVALQRQRGSGQGAKPQHPEMGAWRPHGDRVDRGGGKQRRGQPVLPSRLPRHQRAGRRHEDQNRNEQRNLLAEPDAAPDRSQHEEQAEGERGGTPKVGELAPVREGSKCETRQELQQVARQGLVGLG